MKGLLLRDLYVLWRQYIRRPAEILMILSVLLSLPFAFPMSSLLALLLPLGFSSLSTQIFVADDKNQWQDMLKIMPVSPWEIIISRYLTCLIVVSFATSFSIGINLLTFLLYQQPGYLWYLVFCMTGFAAGLVSVGVSLPACYLLGSEGSNVVAIVLALTIGLSVYGFRKIDLLYYIDRFHSLPLGQLLTIVVIAIVIFLFLSFFLSLRILLWRR